jgi:predicted RecA/RadA family phage recombinase
MEAALYRDSSPATVRWTATEAYSPGQIVQVPDGRIGVIAGLESVAIGEIAVAYVEGQFTVAKTSGVVFLDGDRAYWDRSANTATPLKAVAGADCEMGVVIGDAASADATCVVDLNVQPRYVIDALHNPSDTVLVLTAGTPSLSMGPGYTKMAFSATAEAQKVDILSKHSIPVDIPFIVEGRLAIYDIGDEASVDINVGIANATHASDCDSITESCFLHLDGTALDIKAESDDGTTEVAATDTTVDAVDDTYFDFRMDCRDLTDIQIYINGVNVLPASVFKLNAATGPLKLLAHIEKGANDTLGEVRISHLAIRATDLAA